MCSYITHKVRVEGSAKGADGWMKVDSANVYFDHPFHAPFDHALAIDLYCHANGGQQRVAIELSAEAARALVLAIEKALKEGEEAHDQAELAALHY